jgi:hypothetical protein
MTDMNDTLAFFDLKMEEAIAEAEAHLRSGGACDSDIVTWQQCFLPIWRIFVDENRRKIVEHFSEFPSHTSH